MRELHRVGMVATMAEFTQSLLRIRTSSPDVSTDAREVHFSINERESPHNVSSVTAGEKSQARHGIHCRSSNSICSNNNCYKRTNPFEVPSEQLSQRLCSPSMFRSRSPEQPSSSRSFKWSIEQMAELFPVNIDEEELSSVQPEESYDPFEEQLQQAIDLFFSSQQIVPSPSEPLLRVWSATQAVVGENSGMQTGRELHTATVWSRRTPSELPEVDLCAVLRDTAENRQTDREEITSRRSVKRRLFSNAFEEEINNESWSCQPLSPTTDDSMEGPSSTMPLHMVLQSTPIRDGGFMRSSWNRPSDLEDRITRLSPICAIRGSRSLHAVTPSDH
nr:protein aurora borealis-like [Rhipicephalus microplus]